MFYNLKGTEELLKVLPKEASRIKFVFCKDYSRLSLESGLKGGPRVKPMDDWRFSEFKRTLMMT